MAVRRYHVEVRHLDRQGLVECEDVLWAVAATDEQGVKRDCYVVRGLYELGDRYGSAVAVEDLDEVGRVPCQPNQKLPN